MPSRLHQDVLTETVKELKEQGFNAIDMTGSIPDGIAVKDNKIYAIEVLIIKNLSNEDENWSSHPLVQKKRIKYASFDDIVFKISNKKMGILKPKKEKYVGEHIDVMQRKKIASQIVEDFIDNVLIPMMEKKNA
jgi:hypothetical protein